MQKNILITNSFTDALDLWSRKGLSSHFSFDGDNVEIEFGEEFPETICRFVEKINPKPNKAIIQEIDFSLEWWLSADLHKEKRGTRASFKFLELLMLIAIKGHAFHCIPAFIKIFSSSKFKKIPGELNTDLVSQGVTMVGEWFLSEDENTRSSFVNKEQKQIYQLLEMFCQKKVDYQDALVCLACVAQTIPHKFPDYFLAIFDDLPTMQAIKEIPVDYEALQNIFKPIEDKEGYVYYLIEMFIENPDKAEYKELFGICSNLEIQEKTYKKDDDGKVEILKRLMPKVKREPEPA